MDVKTTFLNNNIVESIYMIQLDEFIEKGQEGKVYELKCSIYGLKQALHS